VLGSQNEDALNERIKKMKEIQDLTQGKLGEIVELGADKSVVSALSETINNINEATQSLVSAARERLAAAALHDKQYDALRAAQSGFVAAAAPAMMDAQVRINAILSSANLSTTDATDAARMVDQLGNIVANGNLAAADMSAALSANDRHRKGFQGRAGARTLQPRGAAEQPDHQGAERGRDKAARARKRQDRRVQAAPEGARRRRLRPDRAR
jgi:hypothetical protein